MILLQCVSVGKVVRPWHVLDNAGCRNMFYLFNTLHNFTGLKAGQVTTCISESNKSLSLGHACGSLGQMKENGDLFYIFKVVTMNSESDSERSWM